MSIRRLYISVLVAFAVIVSASGGWLAWREASRALEAELDTRASWVAGAAAETGLQAALLTGLEPGFEDTQAWSSTHSRLQRLQRYVSEAYIVGPANTALVSSFSADSVPIGTPLRFLDQFAPELAAARLVGNATTRGFRGSDGRLYKWGFTQLEQSDLVLAVLMQADYLSPLAQLRWNLIVGSGLAALLAAVLAGLLAAGIIEPVERLSRVALRIQRGHMDEPVAPERGVELGRLSRAMERMRQGVQQRDEQLRLMLAQVAHEIRNPLGGLELFASAAGEVEDADERRRLIRRIRAEVAALNTIIDDFLTFARPLGPARGTQDLRGALRDAADLVMAEVEKHGGELLVEMPAGPLGARVDEDHAKRATLNLLRNAAQVAQHVVLKAWNARGEVVVSVSDDGPGVPAALKERSFEPFVTDKAQGAGLGLAIVRKVAEANGGRVELTRSGETDGGRGSEFRVYFPSLDEPPPALAAE
ncbi:MAG: HAMP domain-containing histidine kinase [Gemmatimonadetes bacterium]|nr:HAMP domain-containing histidine kinase [Gemmatimonadota bacterium]